MVNAIWLFLLGSGVLVAAAQGKVEVVTTAALEASKTAVNIAFELIGLMTLWLGLLKIAEKAGLVEMLANGMKPITVRLFPSIPRNHPAIGAVVMNLSANMLGLGSAATPFGLKAMQELQKLNPNPDVASDAQCTFLGLNTACITLIPATIIGIRAAAGSGNPTEIVGPTIVATSFSTVVAIVADRYFRARAARRRR